MNENNENKQTTSDVEKKSNNCIFKCTLIGLLIFLGAFCAFYVVADWHYKTISTPDMIFNPKRIEHKMQKDMEEIDKLFMQDSKFSPKQSNIIHLEQMDKFYKITIDLRAFDNNINNIQVKIDGNNLMIMGRTVKKSKHNEQISEFRQSYLFGYNVKLNDLTKETYGNYYVITIPITNEF